MPKDHARVNLAIWNNDDWLDLPPVAQHLYLVLWLHPALSYAGVVEWHPGRLAARAGGWTEEEVRRAAACLEARQFIVIDEATEECLIRSWARFDGLMKQPVMAVSFATARSAVSSRDIRGVIVHEAKKYYEREPNLPGWNKRQVQELLKQRSLAPGERPLPADPLLPVPTPELTPGLGVRQGVGGNPSANPTPTPTPTPSPTPGTQERISDAPAQKTKSTATAPPPLFEKFYAAYPKKRSKAAAVRAFIKAVQRGVPAEVIIAGAERYRDDPNLPDRQFIPYPASWLNDGSWDDEPCDPRTPAPGEKTLAAPNPLHDRLERELAERKARS